MKVDETGRLPAGKHACTVDEMEELFVVNAPNSDHRAGLLQAFHEWHSEISQLIPEHKLWINGGFVTHKPEAPQDMDIVIVTRNVAQIDAMSEEDQEKLMSLLTRGGTEGAPRVQPKNGSIDAFIAFRADPDRTQYWSNQWQRVKGDENATKGFLEVNHGK